ncbi:hypothetical protein ACFVWN_00905 [Nocardiopsis flavescens]|uniref:hypothetical protein n=1 Tax=Nocardiopsis flavescens TaxID=758803 RepID=UPI003666BCB4
MTTYAVTLMRTTDPKRTFVSEVRTAHDYTGRIWHVPRMRMRQVLVDANSPMAAALAAYESRPNEKPGHTMPFRATREAAGQLSTLATDRTALRTLCETLPRISREHHPDLFVGVDANGRILDHGPLERAGLHPGVTQLVGIRPYLPRSETAPLGGLWAPADVHIPEVIGAVPALVDLLAPDSPHVPDPLFTADGARIYLEGMQAWNAHVSRPCRLRLWRRNDEGGFTEAELAPTLLGDDRPLYDECGELVGPLPCGLFTLPVPRIVRSWELAPQ